MLNEKMREQMKEEVEEWMMDNMEWSIEFMNEQGDAYWASEILDLEDLLNDYEDGELYQLVNLIAENDLAPVWDCDEFFFDDDGNIHHVDDLNDVVNEYIEYNDVADMVVDEIACGNIDEPALVEILEKYSLPSWEDVACKIEGIASDMICSLYESRNTLFDIDDNGGDLVSMCRYIVSVNDTAEYLKKTMFCGVDESMYGKIIDDLDNDNLFGVISADADEYVKGMHVSFEKAIEIVVKEEYLKGRWF